MVRAEPVEIVIKHASYSLIRAVDAFSLLAAITSEVLIPITLPGAVNVSTIAHFTPLTSRVDRLPYCSHLGNPSVAHLPATNTVILPRQHVSLTLRELGAVCEVIRP